MGQDKSNFDSKMRSVMQLMKHLNVPDDLETQVATYCKLFATLSATHCHLSYALVGPATDEYKYANHTMFNAEVMNELPGEVTAAGAVPAVAAVAAWSPKAVLTSRGCYSTNTG